MAPDTAAPPALAYTACYCEENVWRAAAALAGTAVAGETVAAADLAAVFVSNAREQIPLWSQRASSLPDGLVVWDYHVVLLWRSPAGARVLDLDSTAPRPIAGLFARGPDYAAATLRPPPATAAHYGPLPPSLDRLFRVVPWPELAATFASDRSHMLVDGAYLQPPPPEPPIQTPTETNTLPVFRRLVAAGGDGPGRVLDERAFVALLHA
ncbi:N-terminal glutamine amidase-domain-containing protein [Dipodascopsis tothii]|uniref:N-terminal glutamine amidase-domain-containing protein n=1 Tax=Dipodascopsis tothii TaxID=44089 RepID=UPI0034CD471D